MNADTPGNSTANFLRMVLLSLCANFNPQYLEGELNCRLRSEYYYQLKALKGKTLKFTTLQKLPLHGMEVDENGVLKGTGVAFDLIHEIQEKIGFYYNITKPDVNLLGDAEKGVIKLLKNKEVDMAVVFIPMLQTFREHISFSTSLTEFEWVLLMARPSASAKGAGLLAPFQEEVWVLILVSLIIVGPSMYLVVYIRRILCRNDVQFNRFYTLPSCVWFVYGALMKQGSVLSPISDSSRVLFATWWIFVTILTSFYTANLTAFLTLSQFTLTIETVKDIYSHKSRWMADKGGNTEYIISYNVTDDLGKLYTTVPALGRFVDLTEEDRFEKALRGEIYVSEKRRAQMMMLRNYVNRTKKGESEKQKCTFVLTPKTVAHAPMAFGYPKNSTLEPLFDPMLRMFDHGGIIAHLLRQDIPLTTICPLNLGSSERKLKNADLFTTYMCVATGFISALITFIAEVIYRFCKGGMKWNEIKTLPINTETLKRSFNKKTIFSNEKTFNTKLNDTFVISQYYNEMMAPYNNYGSYNQNGEYILVQERNHNGLIPNNQPSTFLFQYTN